MIWTRRFDFIPNIFIEAGTKASTIGFAQAGLAVALVPLEPQETLPVGLIATPLNDKRLSIEKTFVKLKDRELSSPMQKLIDFYKENVIEQSR